MKTKLFYLLLFVSLTASAQIVNIPDANFKHALLQSATPNSIFYHVAKNSAGVAMVVDTNHDNEIQVSEALAVYEIRLDYLVGQGYPCASLEGLQAFTNLKFLYCSGSGVSNMPLTGLVNLKELWSRNNNLTSLNLTGLVNLEYIDIVNNTISGTSFSSLINLKTLLCGKSGLTSIDVSGLSNLITLDAGNYSDAGSGVASLNVAGCSSLQELHSVGNSIATLDVSSAISLKIIDVAGNELTSFNISGLSNLEQLNCSYNNLTSLILNGNSALTGLGCQNNNIISLNLSGATVLEHLEASNNNIATLIISGNQGLKTLNCQNNDITSLDLSGAPSLEYLYASNNNLTSINTLACAALLEAELSYNNIQSLSLGSKPFLNMIDCSNNDLISLDISGCTVLHSLNASYNEFTNFDISLCTSLVFIELDGNNELNYLILGSKPLLTELRLNGCDLLEIDFSGCSILTVPDLYGNYNLTYINAKNGPVLLKPDVNFMDDNQSSSSPMVYMCIDEGEESAYSNWYSQFSYIHFNSYCSFTPGANFNTITGTLTFDLDNNGCSTTDVLNDFFKVKIQSGTTTGATFTNSLSQYKFYTQAGNFTLTPEFENSWFTATPATATVNFANNNNNTSTNNFCITSVGSHPDVEVVVYPIGNAQPGFDAYYKVVYKNKGNQTLSGAVTFNYDDAVLDFVSATPVQSAAATGQLTFNYNNLLPFEDRSAIIIMNLNGPMETPPLNNGDDLSFSVAISPTTSDETPADNTFSYQQEIVGSYDPNDIVCLEGDIVSPAEIGDYLHYVVNFENTGTAPTSFIVVRVDVNPAQYDIASLRVMNTSHASDIRVTGNRIEFIMPTAALAAGDHGNILFKMKTKANLVEGNLVKKKANIYFDYNFPIITNDANTTFQALSTGSWTKDESVKLYPNPSAGIVNIKASSAINSIELYDVQGRLLEVQKGNEMNTLIDIAQRAKGIYFVKVITERGAKVEKIIRE